MIFIQWSSKTIQVNYSILSDTPKIPMWKSRTERVALGFVFEHYLNFYLVKQPKSPRNIYVFGDIIAIALMHRMKIACDIERVVCLLGVHSISRPESSRTPRSRSLTVSLRSLRWLSPWGPVALWIVVLDCKFGVFVVLDISMWSEIQ